MLELENEEFEDETLSERLWGLTEMFPEPVRNATEFVFDGSVTVTKSLFNWSKTGLWVLTTTFTVLLLPIICEQERSNIEEQQSLQQRQLLLGVNAASSASSPASGGSIPFGFNAPLPK